MVDLPDPPLGFRTTIFCTLGAVPDCSMVVVVGILSGPYPTAR